MELVFKLPVFEGPLDLLLFLVRKKKLDIREIPISQLADEFLEYLDRMRKMDVRITSDFLEMASTLMELKSKSLLPRMSEEERTEMERKKEELYRRVELYTKVKEVLEKMRQQDNVFRRRPVTLRNRFFSGLEDLESLARVVGRIVEEEKLKERVHRISRETLSVEEMMEEIFEEIKGEESVFTILSRSKSVYELAVRLLAILELLKLERLILLEDFRVRRKEHGT